MSRYCELHDALSISKDEVASAGAEYRAAATQVGWARSERSCDELVPQGEMREKREILAREVRAREALDQAESGLIDARLALKTWKASYPTIAASLERS